MSDYLGMATKVWEDRHELSYEELCRKVTLFQDSPFSIRQLASITGLSWSTVARRVTRDGKKGGRLNPASLRDIGDLSESWAHMNFLDPEKVKSILDNGTSVHTVSVLSGAPEYRLRKAYDSV